jgi:hypothetical protein
MVERVEIHRDAATVTLINGRIALSRALASPTGEKRVFVAAFKGTGRLRFAPSLAMEKQQLAFHSGQEVLETEFTEAVLVFTDSTADELSDQVVFRSGDVTELQGLYEERNKRWTKYGMNWEARLLKALLAAHPERHALFVAELKTRNHGWLTLLVDEADPEQVELVRFNEGRRSRDIWAKFPTGGRTPQEVFADPLAHHEYRLLSYNLAVTVEENAELQGQAEVHLEMKRGGERALLLSLDPNLRVTEVTDAADQPLAFFQPDDPKGKFFLGHYLVVVSPEPFLKGSMSLRLTYAGEHMVQRLGFGNFYCDTFGWYPSYGLGRVSLDENTFAARYDFDLTLRVPKQYQAVAVGEKVEESKDEKYQITRWKSELPLAVAGFAYGDYKIRKEKVRGTQIEIYANKRPDETMRRIVELTSDSYMDSAMKIAGLVAPSRLVKVMAAEMDNSLLLMEKYFGPYPYKKLAVTSIPFSFGQGWPSLLYLSSLSFLTTTQRSDLGLREHVEITDYFRAHEVSHQWWGHVVSWKSYHDQWLSEGFAEFSGILYVLLRKGPDEYLRLLRKGRERLAKKHKGTVLEQIGPIYAGLRLRSAEQPDGYSTIVYRKGGWVLHMIRMMLYDPRIEENPDARFIAMMQDFTRTFHNQAASTEDFKTIVEKHMAPQMDVDGNGKMDWFFNSWVYGTGMPHYDFRYEIEPAGEGGKFVLRGRLKQSRVPADFRTIVPLYLHVGDRKIRAGWLTVRGMETPFQVTLPFKPDKVTLNEWEDILGTVDYK